MKTTLATPEIHISRTREGVHYIGGTRFDWMMSITCSWILIGGYLDAWAHNHIRLETFFTPWHAVLYSGFLSVAFTLIGTTIYNYRQTHSWEKAIPEGYKLSLIGVLFFAIGGVGDMLWHILFGIEVSIDAALSPTHIILTICFMLLVSGPFRSVWQRKSPRGQQSTMTLLPAIISLALMLSVFTIITQFAHPYVMVLATSQGSFDVQALGVVSIILQASILMGLVLLAMRRWQLPFGTFTAVFTLNVVLLSFMQDHYILIPFVAAAGFFADVLRLWLKPSAKRPDALRIFAFAVPAVLYLLYFLALQLTVGVQWTIHLWLGTVVGTGIFGLLISYLLVPPSIPEEQA